MRGLHAQLNHPQCKLVRVVQGEIFDVAVDIRRLSPTFCRWVRVRLSGDNQHQVYIPAGFAHGFCVLSEEAHVEYKCSDHYDPSGELTIAWNDPELGIDWPIDAPVLSDRDRAAPAITAILDRLPR